jgi:hypothetical protein
MNAFKKILKGIGLGLSLSLILVQVVNGACVPGDNYYTPLCSIDTTPPNCSAYNSPEACAAAGPGCCEWKEGGGEQLPPPSGCEICGAFSWLNLGAWLQCITVYLLTFPFRIPLAIIAFIGYGVGYAILYVGMAVVPWIVNQIIQASLTFDITRLEPINKGWEAIKAVSLEFISLFLLVVGLATILRIAEYHARKVLVGLIVAALLISFSYRISVEVVKLGNLFTQKVKGVLEGALGIATSKDDFLNASSIFTNLNGILTTSGLSALNRIFCCDGSWWAFFYDVPTLTGNARGPIVAKLVLITLLPWIIASIIFFIFSSFVAFGLVFLLRTIFLIVLVIVSPIAFITAALRTKEIEKIFPGFLNWNGWWSTFFEWSFVGVNLVIWLTIAGLILKIGSGLLVSNTTSSDLSTSFLIATEGLMTTTSAQMTEPLKEPLRALIVYLIPTLGAAAAIFFGSITSPALARQFSGAVFGFLRQVTSALMTAGAVAVGAFAGAAAGAAVSGAKAIREAEGARGKLEAFAKTAFNVPARGLGALAKEGVTGGLRAAITPLPPEVRKEMITAWRRRVSGEEAKKYVEDVEKKKGPKGVQDVVENKFKTHSDLERMEGIKKAMEERYDKEEWAKDKKIRELMLRVFEDAAKKGDKKTMGMMERRLLLSLGGDFLKRKMEIGKYTEKDIEEDVKSRVFTQEQGKLMKELMEKVKRKEKLSAEEEKALKDLNITKVIAGVKTADDIKQLRKEVIHEEAAMTAMQKFWTGHQWGAAAREFGKELVDALEPLINQLRTFKETNNVEGYLHFVWNRPGLARYSETAAAQELGFSSFYELAPEGIKRNPRYRNIKNILAEKP